MKIFDNFVCVDATYSVPHLQTIARGAASFVRSAGACERIWSDYGFVHNKRRNKLTPARANDIVYVFTNSRMMAKFSRPEKFADWVDEMGEKDSEM